MLLCKLQRVRNQVIQRQQFEVVIQARLGSKPFARERIPPYRKDVLIKSGKLVGGGKQRHYVTYIRCISPPSVLSQVKSGQVDTWGFHSVDTPLG